MTVFDPGAMVAPLDTRAAAVKSSTGTPAVLIEVTRDGRSASVVLGVDDVTTGVAATRSQTFEVGSQTKMMTAVVVQQLAYEGLIDLDAPASRWLPASVTSGIPNADVATVRQMLAMRSGIPGYNDVLAEDGTPLYLKYLEDHPGQPFGTTQALAAARTLPATNAPGAAHYYSNTPYLLLGLLIEAVTGQAWADALQERIFDPVGMTHTSARQFHPDPLRLSSYSRRDGTLVDVTDDLWVPRGESGVVSTTSDLTAFLSALLIEKTLLPPAALAEMTDFVQIRPGGNHSFGLGLFKKVVNGQTLIGFTGGTLGTSSSTWYEPKSGTIVSVGSTLAGSDAGDAVQRLQAALRGLADWAPAEDGTPVEIRSVSAANLGIDASGVTIEFYSGGARLELGLVLRALAAGTTEFEDGSVLLVGDCTADTTADDRANIIRIAEHFPGALLADNRIFGLGGGDDLTGGQGSDRILAGSGADRVLGGAGADRIAGGSGADRLCGGRGDDRISGGDGSDRIKGGLGTDLISGGKHDDLIDGGGGSDILKGGTGHDMFRFDDGDSTAASPDRILDFDPDRDLINLRPVDAVDGGRNSAFEWIGTDDFSGTAGELRYSVTGPGLRLEGDTDGDGLADLAILIEGPHGLSADHVWL